MTTDLIEKVAREMEGELRRYLETASAYYPVISSDQVRARAAIQTVLKEMMEPTEEMQTEGRHEVGFVMDAAPHFGVVATRAYLVMLRTFAQQQGIQIGEGDED